jgi:dihydroxyacetone kinase-like predicted kinase
MIQKINGALFLSFIDSGIRNLALHGKEVNDLNVFPVPDGDTGTNMALTLKNGFSAISDKDNMPLPEMAKAFSSAVLYGARGNSGVIISRFFKGFSEAFYENGQVPPPEDERECLHCGACQRACPSHEECLSAITQKKGELTGEEI